MEAKVLNAHQMHGAWNESMLMGNRSSFIVHPESPINSKPVSTRLDRTLHIDGAQTEVVDG